MICGDNSKQRGPEAETAHNVFYHLTYYEPDDLAKIEDATIRTEIELHISDFGQCPSQLFLKPHPQKKSECVAAQSKVIDVDLEAYFRIFRLIDALLSYISIRLFLHLLSS